MPFFGREPFDRAEAVYVWTGLGTPGFYRITVHGHARKFSSGFKLIRDTHWAGGLAFEVMGWTGPLIEPPATTPYKITDTFHGTFHPEIVIIGSNKTETIHVREIAFTTEENVFKELSAA
jgi:hypothetical protein